MLLALVAGQCHFVKRGVEYGPRLGTNRHGLFCLYNLWDG